MRCVRQSVFTAAKEMMIIIDDYHGCHDNIIISPSVLNRHLQLKVKKKLLSDPCLKVESLLCLILLSMQDTYLNLRSLTVCPHLFSCTYFFY